MADPDPPLVSALARVGDRWTLLLVAALLEGPRRFGELEDAVSGIATNVLTARLRDLEREGLVLAVPYSRRPLRVDYHLTAVGAGLAGALRLLAAWGAASSAEVHGPKHGACGSALEARWWCPTCSYLAEEDGEVWV